MIGRICVYVSDEEEGKGDEGGRGRCVCVSDRVRGNRKERRGD
jgi:hypothetical protein